MNEYPIEKLSLKKYPHLLQEINDPPKTLYYRGVLPAHDSILLCVVGARKFSHYGKDVCETLISGLRGKHITIVSGLALGIDAIAHTAALDAGLKTIAVPGSGLDNKVLYPRLHTHLAMKILESGGALVSEFEPTFKATPWSFPQRNRIMAGMSHAVLVIEAELKSGTLITSKLATDYNRDVLTVPGSIFSKNSEGPHMLIRLGATPITSSNDILDAFNIKTEQLPFQERTDLENCSHEEKIIITILSSPCDRDELIQKSGMSASQANTTLSIMEIKGIITESQGLVRLK